jgi:hypothetical protein
MARESMSSEFVCHEMHGRNCMFKKDICVAETPWCRNWHRKVDGKQLKSSKLQEQSKKSNLQNSIEHILFRIRAKENSTGSQKFRDS